MLLLLLACARPVDLACGDLRIPWSGAARCVGDAHLGGVEGEGASLIWFDGDREGDGVRRAEAGEGTLTVRWACPTSRRHFVFTGEKSIFGEAELLGRLEAIACPELPPHWRLPGAAQALERVLAEEPVVLGIGEIHNTTDGPQIPTTLSRFTAEVLPVLAPRTTDLVLETWRLSGRCGPQEKVVATQMQEDTKRPEVVKDDILLAAEAALKLGVRPHDLTLTCDEYASVLDPRGVVQYSVLLKVVTGKLGEWGGAALARDDTRMVIYGGAMHNDLAPLEALRDYAYAPDLREKAGDRYVELDLYAPELVEDFLLEEAWAPLLAQAGPEHVILIQRAPGSWVLLLQRQGA